MRGEDETKMVNREFNNEVQHLRKELMKSGILGVWHKRRIHISVWRRGIG